MIRIVAAVRFGQQRGDAAHDLVRIRFQGLVTTLAFGRQGRQLERWSHVNCDVRSFEPFQLPEEDGIERAGDAGRQDGVAQFGGQVTDPLLPLDQMPDLRARPLWGDDQHLALFHAGDDFADGFQVWVEAVHEDEIQAFSQPT